MGLRFKQREDGSWEATAVEAETENPIGTAVAQGLLDGISDGATPREAMRELNDMTATELRAFAESKGISIPVNVSRKETLLRHIRNAG